MAFSSFAERLALLIDLDAQGAIREVKKLGDASERELGKAQSSTDKWARGLTTGGAAAVGFAAVAGAALFSFGREAEAAERAELKLENTLQNMPKLAGETTGAFKDQAAELQRLTVATDDEVIAAQAMLGTFNLTKQEILGITPLVVDYARKFDTDLVTAATQVGKALDGQVGALKRNGVSIDENLFKTDRYAAVTQALRNQVGGFAEQEGQTFSGQLTILKNQLGDVAEGLGVGVIGAVSSALGPVRSLSGAFTELSPSTQRSIGTFATFATAAVGAAGALSFLAGQTIKLRERFLNAEGGLNRWGKAAIGAGAAAAGLGIAITLLQADAQAAEQRVDNLTDAVRTLGVTLGEASANQLAEWIGKHDDARLAADQLGFSVEDLNRAITGSQAEYDRVHGPLRAHIDDLYASNQTYGDAWTGARRLEQQLREQRSAYTDAKSDIENTNTATEELRDTELDATAAVDELGTQTEETTEKVVDYQRSLEDATRALREQHDATLTALGSAISYEDAVDRLEDDVRSYQEALDKARDSGFQNADANEELDDATRRLRESVLQTAEAAGKNTEAQLIDAQQRGARISPLEIERAKQESIKAELERQKQLYPELGPIIDEYIRRLSAIPARVTTDLIVSEVRPGERPQRMPVRQSGGPVPGTRGEPVPVLAHGGEYVLDADTVDAITRGSPSAGTARAGATMSGGATPAIVFNIQGLIDSQNLVALLRRVERDTGVSILPPGI